eukprot:7676708-Karenia_brevis.AAC.1
MASAPRKPCNCNGLCCLGKETRRMNIAKNQRAAPPPACRWINPVTLNQTLWERNLTTSALFKICE